MRTSAIAAQILIVLTLSQSLVHSNGMGGAPKRDWIQKEELLGEWIGIGDGGTVCAMTVSSVNDGAVACTLHGRTRVSPMRAIRIDGPHLSAELAGDREIWGDTRVEGSANSILLDLEFQPSGFRVSLYPKTRYAEDLALSVRRLDEVLARQHVPVSD